MLNCRGIPPLNKTHDSDEKFKIPTVRIISHPQNKFLFDSWLSGRLGLFNIFQRALPNVYLPEVEAFHMCLK